MLRHLNETPKKPKRVVVMGAGGFVGGATRKALEADGIEVLGLGSKDVDLLAAGAAEKLAGLLQPGDAFVAVSALAPAKNAEMVIDNLKMAKAMVDALASRGDDIAHVVNVSSDAVYGDTPTPLNEAAAAAPGSYHGVMHLARELNFQTDLPQPVAVIRPTLIYGADDPHNGYGPNKFRRQAAAGEDIVLFGEGEELRDHILVDDVAALIKLMLLHRSTGVLNAVTGHVASFREIAEAVVALHGNPVAVKGSPRKGPMPHNGYRPFNIDACNAAFPTFRFTPLMDGLRQVHAQTEGAG